MPSNANRRIFFNDVETGGTDPKIHGILQIAFIITEPDGTELTEFSSFVAPLPNDKIESKALEINGITYDQINSFPRPHEVYHKIRCILDKYGHCKVKHMRFIPAGYNNQFDLEFINAWMTKIDSKFAFWDFLQFSPIDPLPALRAFRHAGIIDTPNTELATICSYFGIPITAHDALSDIRATKELTFKFYGKLFQLWTGKEHTLIKN